MNQPQARHRELRRRQEGPRRGGQDRQAARLRTDPAAPVKRVLAIAAAALLVSTAAAQAAFPGSNGRIAVEREGTVAQIVSVNPDGTGLHPVTDGTADALERFLRSPEPELLVFDCAPEANVYPMVPAGAALSEMLFEED